MGQTKVLMGEEENKEGVDPIHNGLQGKKANDFSDRDLKLVPSE